jgi:Na+/proline symporter
MTMRDYLPNGLKGLLFVAFLSAYMSTISTQLNWGSSYLTNDLYKRFIKPPYNFKEEDHAEKHYVAVGRLSTVLIIAVSLISTNHISNIDQTTRFLIECGAGLGLVLILRWYWWRINAWSEIAGLLAPFAGYTISNYVLHLDFPENLLLTTLITTVVWIIVTYLTPPEKDHTLIEFYNRIKPSGLWGRFKPDNQTTGDLRYRLICWLSALVMTYCLLFFMGYLIFKEWKWAAFNLGLSLLALWVLLRHVSKIEFFK